MRSAGNLAFLVVSVASFALSATRPTSFVLVGDSTTANGTAPNSGGWGNGFCGSKITGNIASLATGRLASIQHMTEPPQGHSWLTGRIMIYVFRQPSDKWPVDSGIFLSHYQRRGGKGRRTLVTIQFGHNDMKIAPPESMGANLTPVMVQQVRALGGEPVLVTSLTRRSFNSNGTIDDALGPWANETILISQQQKTHLLDLHAASIKYVVAIGPDAAHRLNRLPDDNTHLNVNGTTVFGRMLPISAPIIPNSPLSFSISHGIASF
ncbi:SGNH hydrolase-type esterase domain-containing protein [Flammula alnicola]|nr:SGNH hydrolase-type esterase domain-containing protein [Flammula alnicola]